MENTTSRPAQTASPAQDSPVAAMLSRFAKPLRYLASSLSSTAVDYVVLLGLNATVGGLLLPVVVARVTSCTMNYLVNRKVFAARGGVVAAGLRYTLLAVSVMMMSYFSIKALVAVGLPLWLASVTANTSLFVVNYLGQTFFVFGKVSDLRPALASALVKGKHMVEAMDARVRTAFPVAAAA